MNAIVDTSHCCYLVFVCVLIYVVFHFTSIIISLPTCHMCSATGCKLLLELPSSTPNTARWLELATKYLKNDPMVTRLRHHLRAGSPGGEEVDRLLAGE